MLEATFLPAGIGGPPLNIYGIYIFLPSGRPRTYMPALLNLPRILEADMLDVIFLGSGLAFFAAAIGYVVICERL